MALPPVWNLTDLFTGIDDPAIDRLVAACLKEADRFAMAYRGKLARLTLPEWRKALQAYEKLQQDMALPQTYAYLVFSVNGKNPKHGAFLQKTKQQWLTIYQKVLFFELELVKLGAASLKRISQASELKGYKHFLEQLLIGKPHRLEEREETLMSDLQLTGAAAFSRLFDEELANKTFAWKRGDRQSKTLAQVLDLLHHPDRQLRKYAAEVFSQGLQEESRRLAYILNTLVQAKHVEDRHRHYASPEEQRHDENQTTQAVVDVMTSTVEKYYPLVEKFYLWKRELMGVKELYDHDRYAPLLESKQRVSFEQAQKTVVKTFTDFSPEFGAYAQEFFDRGWIDARPSNGRMNGAYCMPVSPKIHPYLFMNFEGSVKDVRTLAHELGHCIHYRFARRQTYLNYHAPLTLAETASVFAEMLTFSHLRENLKSDEERLALYVGMIEDIFATVFRQTSMYRFEQDLHKAIQEKGEQGVEAINLLWRKQTERMFGSSMTITPGYDIWWSYIHHIFNRPFYVYAYAFGELLTLSLFAKYQHEGKAMIKQYVTLLSAGGSESPEALCKPLGFDLHDPAFWEGGMRYVEELMEEAKRIQASLKKTSKKRAAR